MRWLEKNSYSVVSTTYENLSRWNGLFGGSTYIFLAAKEFSHKEKMVRLVQMRNPSFQGEWTGEWSDISPLWTEELREQIGCYDKYDGTFHMPFENFMTEFA